MLQDVKTTVQKMFFHKRFKLWDEKKERVQDLETEHLNNF